MPINIAVFEFEPKQVSFFELKEKSDAKMIFNLFLTLNNCFSFRYELLEILEIARQNDNTMIKIIILGWTNLIWDLQTFPCFDFEMSLPRPSFHIKFHPFIRKDHFICNGYLKMNIPVFLTLC